MSRQKLCRYCKIEFTIKNNSQMYCSDKCRFFSRVSKDKACWNFISRGDESQYPLFTFRGRVYRVHICSWIIHNGKIKKYLSVFQECANKNCVNPDHLFLATKNIVSNIELKYKKFHAVMRNNLK